MSSNEMAIIENGSRFSKSILWDLERQYFDDKGVDAWETQVPFYITSNPFIANCYAQVIINFVLDRVYANQYDDNSPFYIFEVGTGPGKFSFHLVRRLLELKKTHNIQDVKICYVMTDFAPQNIQFWQEHPGLTSFQEEGILDFALYDIMSSDDITLINQKLTLNKTNIKNPITVLTNYLFDSIPHDVFRVEDGELKEAVTLLKTDKKHLGPEGDLGKVNLDDVKVSFVHKNIDETQYYDNPIFNEVIAGYKDTLNQTSFLIPIAGISFLHHLRAWSGQPLLMISSDKGHSHLSELQGRSDPNIVTHYGECFSMSVNFHAIGQFFKQCDGDYYHQSIRESIKTSVFVSDLKFDDLPLTHAAIKTFIDEVGPGDFFNFHRHLREHHEQCSLKLIISHMHFSRWDPRIFNIFVSKIVESVSSANPILIQSLLNGVDQLTANIYQMPGAYDTYFDLGVFLHALQRYQVALDYYKQSMEYFGRDYKVLYNIALCHYFLANYLAALDYFNQASAVNSNNDDDSINQWIQRIKEKMAEELQTKEPIAIAE